jgi:hypothetical protein
MSEPLQDVDVGDPYAECRDAVASFENSPLSRQMVEAAVREGYSPQQFVDCVIGDAQTQMANGSIAPSDLFLRENEQMRTPAFLRYVAGLMGAM